MNKEQLPQDGGEPGNEDSILYFAPEHEFIAEELVRVCRGILSRRSLKPSEAIDASFFLWAYLHLPTLRSEVSGSLSLVYKFNSSWGKKSIELSEDGLQLSTLESFDSGIGTDHETKIILSVFPDRLNRYSASDNLDGWLDAFVKDASNPDIELSFDCFHSDDLSFLSELPAKS